MKDPLTFFSHEDDYDDGDEVVGPILDDGRAITLLDRALLLDSRRPARTCRRRSADTQFAQSLIFTPENALNLRAIATAYQEGERLRAAVDARGAEGHVLPRARSRPTPPSTRTRSSRSRSGSGRGSGSR